MLGAVIPHWIIQSDHTQQLYDIGVVKLSVDGRLLEELDLVLLTGVKMQSLDCTFHHAAATMPRPFFHRPKLSSAYLFRQPAKPISEGVYIVISIISELLGSNDHFAIIIGASLSEPHLGVVAIEIYIYVRR